MEILLISIAVFVISIGLFLVPYKTSIRGGYPENLWTSDGSWQNPSNSDQILTWDRKEFGCIWAWLVYDAEQNGPAWYAKLAPLYLCIYIFLSSLPTVILGIYLNRKKKLKLLSRTKRYSE
jgi:hypothetical protein